MIEFKQGQVDLAIDIMREVAQWGREKGLRVWMDEWLTRDLLITEEADPSCFYVAYVDKQPAACMILQWQDRLWWPDAPKYQAAYIHKLCVRRDFAGQGLPGACLDYAVKACKSQGAEYVRLDTGWDEERMKVLYTSLGFEIVEKLERQKGKAMALYEYKIPD